MTQDKNRLTFEDLNPTFLFTWKGNGNRKDPYHSHDHLELVFILSGTSRYRIEGGVYTLKEGDILILNPSVRHQVLQTEEENACVEFVVGFSDIQVSGYEKNYIPFLQEGYVLHTTGELKQRIFKLCANMEAENTVDKQGRYFMLKSYLMQILILMIREQSEPLVNAPGYSFESINKKYVVNQIVKYFEDHYSEKISLDRIAENMYLSTFYISKIFKSETGEAPIKYLINIRMEKAREILLEERDMSIQEVAACVGYSDAYHFSKLYKKHFGISPSHTRKE